MKKLMLDVEAFHIAVDQPVLTKPTIPSDERVRLRWNLIEEEFNELHEGMFNSEGDPDVCLVETADALADLIYVIIGTGLEMGIPMDKVWAEVQRSNMDKVRGGIRRREDGKILKPADWQGPDIKGCLECRHLR